MVPIGDVMLLNEMDHVLYVYTGFIHTIDRPDLLDNNIYPPSCPALLTQMWAAVHRLMCTYWPEPHPAIQPEQLIDQQGLDLYIIGHRDT